MACLQISLLGPIRVNLGEEPASGFSTSKVRGLLSYLAVEADRPHQREKLAEMFWPAQPPGRARANLSQALFTLRHALKDSDTTSRYFHISRESIQFNKDSEHWLDVAAFETGLQVLSDQVFGEAALEQLEEALELYRGDFLEEFSINDSAVFEDWATLQREHLRRGLIDALDRLSNFYAQLGDYEPALQHAWRQVELHPWREEAHVTVMRLLALSGQRSQALAQYEICRRILAEELDVEPLKSTTRLYEKIREGILAELDEEDSGFGVQASPPLFLSAKPLSSAAPTTFVAREYELARLDTFLKSAMSGKGRVVFLTGEAGSGKTALLQEFCRRALAKYPNLLVASSKSTAYTGIGDPYATFREILALLTGDIETQWAAGAVDYDGALRLWQTLPFVMHILVEYAPDLVDTFVSGGGILRRASVIIQRSVLDTMPPVWFANLEDIVARKTSIPAALGPQQLALFEQYAHLLAEVAQKIPLLLTLDDLQWADTGSTSLLFHLGRQIQGNRILIIGAYRTSEISRLQNRERHPLEPVVHEFQSNFGDILVPVGETKDRGFVEAFIDSEPNQLSDSFRKVLFRLTGGHPLFTIELLRGLQERGDLMMDDQGNWVQTDTLNWELLPPRIEGVIAERINQLPESLQHLMQTASVQGESFIAEVVARLLGFDEAQIVNYLSRKLQDAYRLVRAQQIKPLGEEGRRLSIYQFQHFLFQKYLYDSLDPIEQATLHQATGTALERIYGSQTDEIAVQLARHFFIARNFDKTAAYRLLAGNRALQMSAIEEAIAHFTQGLRAIDQLVATPSHAQCELNLQLSLGAALKSSKGYASPEMEQAYLRAHDLSKQIGATRQLFPALLSLAAYYAMQPDLGHALELAEQILVEAAGEQEPMHSALGHQTVGYLLVLIGDFASGHEHLKKMIDIYDRDKHASIAYTHGQDSGVTCLVWDAWALGFLGYQDQALQRIDEGIVLAQELEHPFSLTFAHNMAATYATFRRDAEMAKEHADIALQLSKEHGFAFFQESTKYALGWAMVNTGQIETGLAHLRDCLAGYRAMGVGLFCRSLLIFMAEVLAKDGQIEKGLKTIQEAQLTAPEGSERYWEAELYRVKGELMRIAEYPVSDVEACYHQAIQVARQQQAKTLELQATISLCRLWRDQNRQKDAHKRLAQIYSWFSEGFDTPVLQDATRFLEELS